MSTLSAFDHKFGRADWYKNPNYLCIIERAKQPGSAPYLTVKAHLPAEFSYGASSSYATPFAQTITERVPAPIGNLLSATGVQLVTQALTAQVWQGSSPIEMSLELHFHAETNVMQDVIEPVLSLQRLVTPSVSPNGGFLRSPGPQLDYEQIKVLLNSGVETTSDLLSGTGEVASQAASAATSSAASYAKSAAEAAWNNVVSVLPKPLEKALSTDSPGKAAKGQLPTLGNVADSVVSGTLTYAGKAAEKVDQAAGELNRSLLGAITNNTSITIGQFLRFSSVVVTNVVPTFKTLPLEDGSMSYATVTLTFSTFLTPTESDLLQMYLSKTAPRSQTTSAAQKGMSLPGAAAASSLVSSAKGALDSVTQVADAGSSIVRRAASIFG